VEPILNEISVVPIDGVSTDDRLRELAETLKALRLLGASRALLRTKDALERPICQHETFRTSLFANRGHREARQLLISALSWPPFVEDLQARSESANGCLVEVRHGDRHATGLGMALLLRSISVSLLGAHDFHTASVPVSVTELIEIEQIQISNQSVLNVWNCNSVEGARVEILERIARAVVSGEHAWARRTELFSHLEWSRESEAHLRSLLGSELVFFCVIDRLVKVNSYTATWSGGPFEPPVRFSPEAEGTLQHGRRGAERECTLPSGQTKRLSLHIKLTDYWRIYFEFRQVNELSSDGLPRGRAFIGYIGKHLP